MAETYDFRSDTVTLPTPEMMRAIATARLGDSGRGDDPTVNDLERLSAVHAEANPFSVGRRSCRLDALGVRIEGVNARSTSGDEAGEAAFAAADLENPDALERNETLDPTRLGLVQVGDVHA